MEKHEQYKVGTDFNGGYVVKAKIEGIWYQVARYDAEGGESFSNSVTSEQKEDIRRFARRAYIL
ncbi:MAG: hypothetical protein HFJ35_04590 [Clostridia bacterium]|nr:hypothetical protein [Clostridia bacterium]